MLDRSLLVLPLLVLLSGCFLLRTPLKKRLPPLDMVELDGGTFVMGDFDEGANDDALPLHTVIIEPFAIGRTEVTYAQYDSFAVLTGRALPDDDDFGRGDRAVVNVTWDDAAAFCAAYGYRLPTEAEWEYAARSGGREDRYAGTNAPDSLAHYARYQGNSVGLGSLVASKRPNALGLYDMSGNVAEWVGDYYQSYPEPGEAPEYNSVSSIRIIRGGSFSHDESVLRTYWRTGTLNDIHTFTVGFRCAASLD